MDTSRSGAAIVSLEVSGHIYKWNESYHFNLAIFYIFFNIKKYTLVKESEDEEFYCQPCERSFESERGLKVHIGRAHKKNSRQITNSVSTADSNSSQVVSTSAHNSAIPSDQRSPQIRLSEHTAPSQIKSDIVKRFRIPFIIASKILI